MLDVIVCDALPDTITQHEQPCRWIAKAALCGEALPTLMRNAIDVAQKAVPQSSESGAWVS